MLYLLSSLSFATSIDFQVYIMLISINSIKYTKSIQIKYNKFIVEMKENNIYIDFHLTMLSQCVSRCSKIKIINSNRKMILFYLSR